MVKSNRRVRKVTAVVFAIFYSIGFFLVFARFLSIDVRAPILYLSLGGFFPLSYVLFSFVSIFATVWYYSHALIPMFLLRDRKLGGVMTAVLVLMLAFGPGLLGNQLIRNALLPLQRSPVEAASNVQTDQHVLIFRDPIQQGAIDRLLSLSTVDFVSVPDDGRIANKYCGPTQLDCLFLKTYGLQNGRVESVDNVQSDPNIFIYAEVTELQLPDWSVPMLLYPGSATYQYTDTNVQGLEGRLSIAPDSRRFGYQAVTMPAYLTLDDSLTVSIAGFKFAMTSRRINEYAAPLDLNIIFHRRFWESASGSGS